MKSIKPGRGPSKNAGVSSIFAAIFGIMWTIIAISMGAWIMIPFGIIFIAIAIYQATYNFKNANSKNRNSIIDIVDSEEEPDPLNEQFDIDQKDYDFDTEASSLGAKYCPYCGAKTKEEYSYCQKCGKKIPK